MIRRELTKDKKGQFLVLISLGIVVLMITFSSLLSYTAVSPIYFPKTNFKETTTQLSINFRQALAISLADVSKELDRRASIRQYINYTKLDEYPEAKDKGYESLTEWQKITFLRQSGLGLNLSISEPIFQCNWGSAEGYSRAMANMTLDILSYGFYDWKSEVTVELSLTILSLTYLDENITSFGFNLKREQGIPVSGLTPSSIKIFFQIDEDRFDTNPASIFGLAYFGGGNYLLTIDTRNATYPVIKMILQDPNGIVVGAYSALSMEEGLAGPLTTITLTRDKYPYGPTKYINITATIDNTYPGGSWYNIAAAEYFTDAPGPSGTGAPMIPVDGSFDSPKEDVWVQINVTGWQLGNYIIYVHGKDSRGIWGNFASATLKIEEAQMMHVNSIDMSWRTQGRRARAVVTIVDSEGNSVVGATVYGTWTYTKTTPNSVSGTTNGSGQVTFLSKYVSSGGTFTFTVDNVVLTDWTYDSDANVETSDWIPR